MDLRTLTKEALRNLRRSPLRSGLTVLGVVIGVAAVIAMVSIGNGAKAEVEETIASMDINRLAVGASMPRETWPNGVPIDVPPGDGLRIDDYLSIRKEIPGITAASVQITAQNAELSTNGRGSQGQITGVDVDGWKLSSRRIIRGANFGDTDVRIAATVCLISSFLAGHLFDDNDPIGRLIRIQNTPFIVIGVLEDSQQVDPRLPDVRDTTVLIPYTSLLRRLDRNAEITIMLKPESPANLTVLQQQVSDLLERRRGKRRATFVAGNMKQATRLYEESGQTLVLLLGAVGGLSLIVGGVGIMNIMLVSVTERTREIGILMALGTRDRDVLRQFLIEAIILSMIGGVLGILLGICSTYVLTYFYGWKTKITIDAVLAAFAFSAAIGIGFGYYPARRAARLDPIQALRSA